MLLIAGHFPKKTKELFSTQPVIQKQHTAKLIRLVVGYHRMGSIGSTENLYDESAVEVNEDGNILRKLTKLSEKY